MDYNELATQIYEQNKAVGWWDDPNRCIFECLQLVSTEVAEATEGERKNLMDSHLPHRRNGEVELADALIRVLDIGGRFGLVAATPAPNMALALTLEKWSIGKRFLYINNAILNLAARVAEDGTLENSGRVRYPYTELISYVLAVASSLGYDLNAAMLEKLEYNKTRADHKLENRAKENGKRF